MQVRSLPEGLQKKANEELSEVPSRIPEDIIHIRTWIEKQPHLKIRTDDQHILAFLRGCKFSLQRTKEKIDFFYGMRSIVPEFFANRDPLSQDTQRVIKARAVLALPKPTDSLEATILMLRWDVCNYETITLTAILKVILMSLDVSMNDDDSILVSGIKFLIDFAGFSIKYATQFTPAVVKKFLLCIQNAYPIRIKAIYIVNAPPIFDTLYAITKPFTTTKFKSRVHIYTESDINKFYDDVPPNVLPKDYGGDLTSVSNIADKWSEKLANYRQWFLDDAKFRSDEKLRPVTSKTFISDTLNMEGSFRKLNID